MPAHPPFETDVLPTAAGELEITFFGHGSLLFEFGGKTYYVDPYGETADYQRLPAADVVLITHEHSDHLDPAALAHIRTPKTVIIYNAGCQARLPGGTVLNNGETQRLDDVLVEAVPAYNLVHKRPDGNPFHPQGAGNGYVLTFGDLRVYVGGDTENIPEMKTLRDIAVAFLPMNLPYTMTPEMVADAARGFLPRILYPYHFGKTDTAKLAPLLAGLPVEVRIRNMP